MVQSEVLERFVAEVARTGGRAQLCDDRSQAIRSILGRIEEGECVLVEASPVLKELHLPRVLASRGIEVIESAEARLPEREAQVGVTGALAGVADSGSLLLGGPSGGMWQWASLLPEVHIAVLPADRVRSDLGEAFRDLERAREWGPGEFVWVTGPSRTADIAVTPILGMHGPTELHVVVVP